jgi:amino acid adenylation domain-containing protein
MITSGHFPATIAPTTWVLDRISAIAQSPDPAICATVALRTTRAEVTYAELWERARKSAGELSALGASPGDIVGVRLPSGPDVVVAMLAIWLVDAAFLPMDAAIPDEYRDRLLSGSGATAVIDDQGSRALDGTGVAVRGDRLAYVIYTSGSTGAPKGVLVGHDAFARHTEAVTDLLGLRRADTVLQFAGLGFDVAQEEIWPTLAVGGTVAFLDTATRALSPAELAGHVGDLGVSVLQLPTAYWRLVCSQMQPTDRTDKAVPSFAGVHTVVIGGESATTKDVLAHRNSPLGRARLINGYGPTETVVTCTALVLRPDEPLPMVAGLPIGEPVGERRLYVLDADRRPVAPGTPGELWIGGRPLADGYLGDPERTAERFHPDPFTPWADGRMYRTGDLGVRHGDGAVEFLGRLDNQVKVRGYRIELDEVDRHLLAVPGVTAAAATAPDDGTGTGGRILAAAVSVSANGPTADEIRQHLRGRLPRPMIPTRIDVHDRLPLTASGKIDRRALAAQVAEHAAPAEPDGTAAAPSDALTVLLGSVRTVLRAPGFGPDLRRRLARRAAGDRIDARAGLAPARVRPHGRGQRTDGRRPHGADVTGALSSPAHRAAGNALDLLEGCS